MNKRFAAVLVTSMLWAGFAAAEPASVAGLLPSDLARVGIKGSWSAFATDFSGLSGTDEEGGRYVFSGLFDWRDKGASMIEATVHLTADAAEATKEFERLRAYDLDHFGAATGRAAVGDDSRTLSRRTPASAEVTNTIRWRSGSYVVRLSSIGSRPLPHRSLAALAASLSPSLPRLAGQVAPPAALTRLLPPADATLPELGTAVGSTDWWVWAQDKNGRSVPSRKLQRLLAKAGQDAVVVARTYAVPSLPGHYAMVSILPFASAADADHYLRASLNTTKSFSGKDFHLQEPSPARDHFTWRADATVGRYVYEVDCLAERGGTNPGCQAVTRRLADLTIDMLTRER